MSHVGYKGTIITPVNGDRTSKGAEYWEWSMRTASKTLHCKLWGKYAEGVNIGKIQLDKELAVKGFFSENKKVGFEKEFVVTWLRLEEDRKENKEDKIKRNFGSMDQYRKDVKRYADKKLEAGYVMVPYYGWKKKEDCIYINNRWESKIDFLMNTLGPKVVSNEILSFWKSTATNKTPTRLNGNLTQLKFPVAEYKQKIDELIEHANYFLNNPNEMDSSLL